MNTRHAKAFCTSLLRHVSPPAAPFRPSPVPDCSTLGPLGDFHCLHSTFTPTSITPGRVFLPIVRPDTEPINRVRSQWPLYHLSAAAVEDAVLSSCSRPGAMFGHQGAVSAHGVSYARMEQSHGTAPISTELKEPHCDHGWASTGFKVAVKYP